MFADWTLNVLAALPNSPGAALQWKWQMSWNPTYMNWCSQLAQLILSFYREEPLQLQQLSFLRSCKVVRRWGVLKINCDSRETARKAIGASDLLKAPVAQMRLAHEMKILVKGDLVKALPIDSSTTLLN